MSENINECLCGRKRQKMNDTNWKRHLTACNVAKLKSSKAVTNIWSYITKKRTINDEVHPSLPNKDITKDKISSTISNFGSSVTQLNVLNPVNTNTTVATIDLVTDSIASCSQMNVVGESPHLYSVCSDEDQSNELSTGPIEDTTNDKIASVTSKFGSSVTQLNVLNPVNTNTTVATIDLDINSIASCSQMNVVGELKLIKTRIRSTMVHKRLDSLMLLSCEKDIIINIDEAINKYANTSKLLQEALLYK